MMINYRLVIKCWSDSYGYHKGYIVQVLMLHVHVTKDDSMHVDLKTFKTAIHFGCHIVFCRMLPKEIECNV